MPDDKTFILVGTDSTSFLAQASKVSLIVPVEFAVLVWTSLRDITDPAQITTLTVCANASPKKFLPCTTIPPLLATILIDQGGTSILDLISTAVTKIFSFTAEQEDDSDFLSANNHAQPIVNWLWATMKEDLPSLNASPSIDPIIIARSKEIHEHFFHTIVPPNK